MRSWQSLGNMMLKSRCSRTVEDERSCQVCQTRGRLGTKAHNGVANTVDQQRRPSRRSRHENGVDGEMPEQHAIAGEGQSVVEEEPT
uniref:Uncharacterized protein n=1 Tax=Leersia perrieri TaxID=77586 RepID=A0A0D9W2P7_9ORYZ